MKKIFLGIFLFTASLTFALDKYLILEDQYRYDNLFKIGAGVREHWENFGADCFIKISSDSFVKSKSLEGKGIYYFDDIYCGLGLEMNVIQYNKFYFNDSRTYYSLSPLFSVGYDVKKYFVELDYSPISKITHNNNQHRPSFGVKVGFKL